MARLSASSSTSKANGHATTTTTNGEATRPLREYTDEDFDFEHPAYAEKIRALPFDPSLLPNGSRSLSSIGLQSFSLGFSLASCTFMTAWFVATENTIWRLPAFFACLSLFHFLEYWTTARFNSPEARASSFLLFNNGTAYNVAHSLATLEIIISKFFSGYQEYFVSKYSIAAGIILILVGQVVRSVAMAQAGTNFNHTPAKVRKEGHVLVTAGIYGWLRHPSYFGFFWWALGTQILVGNKVCFVGYALVLWRFFYKRIIGTHNIVVS